MELGRCGHADRADRDRIPDRHRIAPIRARRAVRDRHILPSVHGHGRDAGFRSRSVCSGTDEARPCVAPPGNQAAAPPSSTSLDRRVHGSLSRRFMIKGAPGSGGRMRARVAAASRVDRLRRQASGTQLGVHTEKAGSGVTASEFRDRFGHQIFDHSHRHGPEPVHRDLRQDAALAHDDHVAACADAHVRGDREPERVGRVTVGGER